MRRVGAVLGTVLVAAVLATGCGGGTERTASGPTATESAELARQQVMRHAREVTKAAERDRQWTRERQKTAEREAWEKQQGVEDVAVGVTGVTAGEAPTGGEVAKSEFGSRWPLTVSHGTLSCDGYSVVFAAPEGMRYGLNGTAQDQLGLPPIDPIWRYEPGMKRYGLKVDIGPLIQRGLALC
jgi:hypothetical protein